jgi:hypothetical protein
MTSERLFCPRPRRRPLLAAILCAPLAAQQPEYKPAPLPDPIKGMHDIAPMRPDELARRTQRSPSPRFTGAVARQVPQQRRDLFADVLFDQLADGRIWVRGATYKASFGPDGFVYVPDFGSAAPRNYPVHFVLRAARVGGGELPFDTVAPPLRDGRRSPAPPTSWGPRSPCKPSPRARGPASGRCACRTRSTSPSGDALAPVTPPPRCKRAARRAWLRDLARTSPVAPWPRLRIAHQLLCEAGGPGIR